jgi:hypothetical protein
MTVQRFLAVVLAAIAGTTLVACGGGSPAATTSASDRESALDRRIARERKDAAAEAIRDREVEELKAEVKELKREKAKTRTGHAQTVTVQSPPAAQPAATSAGGVDGSWPSSVSGWTVILDSTDTADGAASAAARARSAGLTEVGQLYSSDFRTLRPGWYVAYTGRFETKAEAMTRAVAARAAGFGEAYQRYVGAE